LGKDPLTQNTTPSKAPKKKTSAKKGGTKRKKAGGGAFDGLVFCVSGSFTKSQSEMKKLLEENGGTVAGSVTAKVTHLVGSDAGTGKAAKAVEKGIPVVTEEWVDKSVEEGAPSTDTSLMLSSGGADDAPKKKKAKTPKKKDDDAEDEEEEEAPKKKKSCT